MIFKKIEGRRYVIVLEVRTQYTPAKFANVRDDKARPEFRPGDKMLRLWIVDHPTTKNQYLKKCGEERYGLV
jgi:hypothetical protein